jgi:very-short-patch-repair endonuclease
MGSSMRGADARRDVRLARLGYRILRLEAKLVMRQLPLALERIRAALGLRGVQRRQASRAHPQLLKAAYQS